MTIAVLNENSWFNYSILYCVLNKYGDSNLICIINNFFCVLELKVKIITHLKVDIPTFIVYFYRNVWQFQIIIERSENKKICT